MPGVTVSQQSVHPMAAIPVIRATTDLSTLNPHGSAAQLFTVVLSVWPETPLSGRMGVPKFKDGTQAAVIDFN